MFGNVFFLLAFSVVALVIYEFYGKRQKALFFSIINFIFYILLEYRYAILLFFSMGVTYYVIFAGQRTEKRREKGIWGKAGILYVLIVLCVFKYFSFFTKDMSLVFQLTMPIGISYYSFKMISTIADVCLKEEKWNYTFMQYITYISFFPQIMCGPITKIDCFDFRENAGEICKKNKVDAFYLIVLGLFKKLVIAERLAVYTNTVFGAYKEYPALALWLNAVFYSFQLYCDFSGYSDIAIAFTHLFGFKCDENFRRPYFSASVKEFWTRWHISLSKWLKEYIYIPLGGNRKGKLRKQLNTLAVFVVSGIWHGNTLNFLVWGIWHAVFNILSPKRVEGKKRFIYGWTTFFVVTMGWIFFYYTNITDALAYIGYMMTDLSISTNVIIQTALPFTMDYACFAHLGVVLIMLAILFGEEFVRERNSQKHLDIIRGIQIVCIVLFGVIGTNGFVYANF